MDPKKQITLDDIAKELKISKVAVSKALRDHPDISSDTKTLVSETAARLGYVPNFVARNLSSRKSNIIGLVVPKVAHHFLSDAIEHIYEHAYKKKYEIFMTVSEENPDYELHHLQSLLSMRVDGLLISVTENTKDLAIFETIKNRGVPLVFFDRVINDLGFSCVTSDDEGGSFEAVTYLVKAGFTKIAHIAGYEYTSIGRLRKSGFLKGVKKHRLHVPEEWILEGGFSEDSGYKNMIRLFKSGNMPEVIFTVTYPVAIGVMLAAEELGISVPEELNIFCFGGSHYNHFIKPSLSFVRQPVEQIAKTAVNLIIDEINDINLKPQNIKIPTEVVICDTCLNKLENNFYE
jgi:LacI family transcriptional regulator, galactose operon repressor